MGSCLILASPAFRLLLITGMRCVNGCIRGLEGEEARERGGWARVGTHRPPFIDRRALIREFNCQPYESEPVIDSMRTSLSIGRNHRVVCTCCACILPAAALQNVLSLSYFLSFLLSLSLSLFLSSISVLYSHVIPRTRFFSFRSSFYRFFKLKCIIEYLS